MSSHAAVEQPNHDAVLAASRVFESAIDLARAEAKLLFAHARRELFRTVGAVLAGMLATSAAQVALVLWALSPVLLASRSALLTALLPSLGVSALGTLLAVFALRSLRNPGTGVSVPK